MIEKENLPPRIRRLRDLARGLGRELALFLPGQHRLEPAELAVYREALLDAIHRAWTRARGSRRRCLCGWARCEALPQSRARRGKCMASAIGEFPASAN